jgi:hypothetical protein
MPKKQTNEGLFSAAKRFSDAFFDGLSNNLGNRVIEKAKKAGAPPELIRAMDKIQRDKDELDALLNKY